VRATVDGSQATIEVSPAGQAKLPTLPCSVVWSGGHSYVLEGTGNARWVGLDDRGRPLTLTSRDLQRRGWSPHPPR
jgi:hypothetical protein